jgi:flagella basal body P-ring formation protein FlgA
MNRITLALVSLVAATGAAIAAPVLKSEVTVIHGIVTVGDMFDNPGANSERALFISPAPGTTGTVSLDAVKEAATLAGITEYTADGVLRVRVARAATLVDEAMLTGLITSDLTARGIVANGVTVEARFDKPGTVFSAEAVDVPVQIETLRYTPANGAFAVRLLIAGMDAPVDVTGRIELLVEAPHLATNRVAGTILAPDDIEMRLIPLKFAETNGIATVDQLIGKQLIRQSRAGLLLRANDVAEPKVVERNAMVMVVVTSNGMMLSMKGQALNGAAAGQPVQVLNTVSRKILHGVALPNGAVAVTNTIAVAAL